MCALVGLLIWPGSAAADPQQQLDLATTRYENGQYKDAAEIFKGLLSIKADPETEEGKRRLQIYLTARPMYATCLVALQDIEGADAVILDQFRANPFYELPAAQYPQAVSDRFIDVSTRNRTLIESWKKAMIRTQQIEAAERARIEQARRERLERLEQMAAEEKVVTSRTRLLALVPFGVGQFQNDNLGLGVFFATTETLALGTSIVSFIISDDIKDTTCPDIDEQSGLPLDCAALQDQFEAARVVNWVSFGTAIALVVGGIIEAQISFEPNSVEIRKRNIPPPVEMDIKPDGGTTPTGGAWFTLQLRGKF